MSKAVSIDRRVGREFEMQTLGLSTGAQMTAEQFASQATVAPELAGREGK